MMTLFLCIFVLSFALTYAVKNYAIKKSLVDIPNDRSSHTVATPHGGGIAIAVTWFMGIGYLFGIDRIEADLFYALMVGTVIAVVSYLDDLYELKPRTRFLTQLFVALTGLWFLGGLNELDFGLFTIENPIITNTVAAVGIIWFINLYNFLDGIDGYAGSEAIFLGIAGYLLFGDAHFLVLIASVLGFLIWNWHKAKIFMGDVGSTLLGYNVAVFTIYYANQESTNLWVWIILFGLFWFDATLTLYRRYRNKEKLSEAHKKHVYQRLTQSGWSHSKVVIYSMAVNVVLFAIVYTVPNVFIAFIVSLVFLYLVVRFVDRKKAFGVTK